MAKIKKAVIDDMEEIYRRIICGEFSYQEQKTTKEQKDDRTGEKIKTESSVKQVPPNPAALAEWLRAHGRLTIKDSHDAYGVVALPQTKEDVS